MEAFVRYTCGGIYQIYCLSPSVYKRNNHLSEDDRTCHLIMTKIAMEKLVYKWRFLAGKTHLFLWAMASMPNYVEEPEGSHY